MKCNGRVYYLGLGAMITCYIMLFRLGAWAELACICHSLCCKHPQSKPKHRCMGLAIFVMRNQQLGTAENTSLPLSWARMSMGTCLEPTLYG